MGDLNDRWMILLHIHIYVNKMCKSLFPNLAWHLSLETQAKEKTMNKNLRKKREKNEHLSKDAMHWKTI